MPVYLVLLIFFISIVYIKIKRSARSIDIMKMSLWLLISYSFLLITHLLSGISYNTGNILRILPYFFLCLILLLTGDFLGEKIKMTPFRKSFKIKLKYISYSSIFGSVLFLSDIIRLNRITFGSRIEDFQVSSIGAFGNLLTGLGILAWIFSLYEYRLYKIRIPLLSYLSIISFVSGGILSAGRQAILLIGLSSMIMLIWSNRKIKESETDSRPISPKKNRPWGIIIIFSLFVGYFLFISYIRTGIFDINKKMNMLERGFNARISDKTMSTVYQMKPLSDIYIEYLFYYSHELHHLDLMYQYYDYHPLFGLAQMTYVERRLHWLFGKQGDNSKEKIANAVEVKGAFSSQTWGTFITNYILDFGRFGSLIICFLTGLTIGILYRGIKDNQTPENILRHCIILAGIIFSIQYSPFCEIIFTFPIIFISFIKIDNPNSTLAQPNLVLIKE